MDLLLQVLDNLIGHGIKFNRTEGHLVIRAYTWPDICKASPLQKGNQAPHCEFFSPLPKLRIEVSDTGYGINEIDQRRIFERFYRVENAVHTQAGTGLGLAIVREIVEKHGGKVFMVSEPNVGTTFWFDLPLELADQDELKLESERKDREWATSQLIKVD